MKDINLYDTLFSGQCFRVTLENDVYTLILSDRVVKINDKGLVSSSKLDNIDEVLNNYLDLNTDYKTLNKMLSSKIKDINLCEGYHILKQDAFEMFITYIISQNNKVNRISHIVNLLSKQYGTKVRFEDKDYYLFPTYEQIKDITVEELRSLGVGFRDKYIRNALDYLKDNPTFLSDINSMSTKEALNKLTSIKGVGVKVASCILLFTYSRFDCFPIDTWVRKYISKNYNIKDDIKVISKYMEKEFASYSALAIQYFYHIERNKKGNVL